MWLYKIIFKKFIKSPNKLIFKTKTIQIAYWSIFIWFH
jgi:hypothetical protein